MYDSFRFLVDDENMRLFFSCFQRTSTIMLCMFHMTRCAAVMP